MPKKLTRNRLPLARRFRPRLLSAAIMAAGQALYSLPAMAGPEGGKVTGGDGTIEYNGELTTIEQLSDRLAVDWDSFDVSADEIVNFLQPGRHSIALNRILGHNGSEILGQINASGRVVLVNPHGIVFGEGARVNVGGMLASGLDIGVEEFMAGHLTFSALEGAEGRVVNRGIIQAATGGSATLLGQQVSNDGLISAHLGSVNLAAGKEAVVTFDPEGLMGVRVTRAMAQEELGAEAALSNSGTLEAQGGRILLTASTSQELFSQAVNRGGQEQASSVVVHEDGSFTLGGGADVVNTGRLDVSSDAQSAGEIAVLGENVTHSGQADASGTGQADSGHIELHAQDTTLLTENAVLSANSQAEEGGTIKILGHKVGLMGRSLVEASGALEGGDLLVGGDYKGGNAQVRNAWRTYVGPQANLKANALEGGDGGRIIVWANDITRYYGSLEGNGKGVLGQGGFAEVSGKELLGFDGSASLSGPGGVGTLLLDPRDISIIEQYTGIDNDNELSQTSQDETRVAFSDDIGSDSDAVFTSEKIEKLLEGSDGESGTNIILEATRDIFVQHSIVVGSENTNSLTLKSGDDIQVATDKNIDLGKGHLHFYAGVASCGVPCSTEDGVNDEHNNLAGRNIDIRGELNTAGEIVLRAADNVFINNAVGGSTSPSAVSIRAGNDTTLGNEASIATAATSPSSDETTITMVAGDASLTDATDLTIDHIQLKASSYSNKNLAIQGLLNSDGGNIFLNTDGAIALQAVATTQGGNFFVGESSGSRAGSFDSSVLSVDTSSSGAGGSITIYSKGNATLRGASFGTLAVNSSEGNITLNNDYSYYSDKTGANGKIDLTSASGDVYFDESRIDNEPEASALDITISAGGLVSLDSDSKGLYLNGGDFKVTNSDSIELNQKTFKTEGGVVNLQSSGDIKVQKALQTEGGSFTVASSSSFTNLDAIDTEGGLVELASSGAISIDSLLNTGGGAFTVIGSGSFTNSNIIKTQTSASAGDVTITSSGDVTLGKLDVNVVPSDQQNASDDSHWGGSVEVTSAQNITLDQEFDFNNTGNNDDGGSGSRSLILNATNNISIDSTIRDSSDYSSGLSYYDTLDVTLNADTDGSGEGDVVLGSSVYTAGGFFNASGVNFAANGYDVNTNEGKAGVESSSSTGGHITLTMTGDVNLGGLITKTGDTFGDLTIAGGTITGSAPLTINGTSSFTATSTGIQLGGENQLRGAVDITSVGDVTLVNRHDTTLDASSISGNFNLTSSGDIGSIGAVNVTGSSTFTVSDGGNSHHALNLSNRGNNFAGEVAIGRASSVNLYSQEDLTVGAITTTGENNVDGGDITLEAGKSLTVAALEANAGTRTIGKYGANSGAIVLKGGSVITLTNNLSARAHSGGGTENDGSSDGIELTGDVVLNADSSLSGSIIFNTQMLADSTGNAGNVTFSGALDGQGSSEQNLQIDAGAVTFFGAIGQNAGLNALAVNARGNVVLRGDVEPSANSIVITGQGDASQSLTAAGTSNTWELHQDADGSGSATPNTLNTLIEFTGFDKLVGGSADDHFNIQFSGADFTLDGGSATGNQLTAPGNWSVLADGSGSVVDGGGTTGFSEIQILQGSGTNALQGPSSATTWTITSANGGLVEQTVVEGGIASYSYTFKDMEALVGGEGNDSFVFTIDEQAETTGSLSGSLDGGGGITNSVTGRNIDNLWAMGTDGNDPSLNQLLDNSDSAAPVAYVAQFSNIDKLQGGSSSDIFQFGDEAALIDIDGGSAEGNRLDFSQKTQDVTVTIGSGELGSVENVQGFIGNSEQGASATLAIVDGDNEWNLVGQSGESKLVSIKHGDAVFSGFNVVHGGSGKDDFVLASGENFIGSVNGGTGSGDTLTVHGGTNSWSLTSPHGGDVGSRVQSFSNIQTLSGAGSDTLTGRDQNNAWSLDGTGSWSVQNANDASDRVSFSGMSILKGNSAEDHFTLAAGQNFIGTLDGVSNSGNSLTVHGGTNSWALTSAHGGAVTNRGEPGTRLKTFSNIQTLHGTDFDEIQGLNQMTYWSSEADDIWTLSSSDSQSDQYLTLTGMNTLVGGTGKDTFTLSTGTDFTGTIDGGVSSGDTLEVQGGGSAWSIIQYGTNGAEGEVNSRGTEFFAINVLTGAEGDRLAGPNQANDWTLTGTDAGTVSAADITGAAIEFSGMSALVGGNDTDTFVTSGTDFFVGVIDGGSGNDDTLNLLRLANSQAITVGMLEPDNSASSWQARDDDDVTVRNIETLRAGEAANDVGNDRGNTLLGPVAGRYIWTLTDQNIGTVEPSPSGSLDTTLGFFGFAYLQGGEHSDLRFDGGTVTGGITGGTGETWLDYSLVDEDLCVNLLSDSSACDGPVVSGIDGVIGNSSAGFNSQLLANGSDGYIWVIDDNGHDRADGTNDGEFRHGNETIAFIDFNQLLGGSGEDRFRFQGLGRLSGYLNGRGGSDIVNSLQTTRDMAFRLEETAPEGSNGAGVWLKGVETLTANGSRNNQLIGYDRETDWVVDGENSGHLDDNAIAFSGIGQLWGGQGNNTFTIEESGSLSVGVIGGNDVGTDRLVINSNSNDTVAWSVTGDGMGTADRAGSFSEVEVLGGGQGHDRFTLNDVDAWVDSMAGGSGNNTVSYEADEVQPVSATWTLSGARNGSVAIGESENAVGFTAIGGIEGAGNDRLIASDATNDWHLSSANGGTLKTTTAGSSQSLTFSGVATLQGNDGIDHFTLDSGVNFAGTLLGENGNDEVSASGSNTWTLSATGTGTVNEVTYFEGIQTLNGGGQNNELIAPERNNHWRLTGERSGTLDDADTADSRVLFNGMDTLTGNSLRDTFVATAELNRQELRGFAALNGGAGANDSLTLSNLTQAVTLSLGQPEDGQESEHGVDIDSFISGFETLDAANYDNHLLGASDRAYRWVVTDLNRGRVEQFEGNTAQTTVAFTNFSRLTGGSASDTFAILDGGDTSGVIDGGDGINLVDYSLKTEDVNVIFGGLDEDIRNISGVIGNNGGSGDLTSKLVLGETNDTSAWRIGSIADIDQSCAEGCRNDGVNDGQVTLNGESLYFIDFNRLEGGSGRDTFTVAEDGRFIGTLNGAGGADTLNIARAVESQRVGFGEFTVADTNLLGVETLIGSSSRLHALYAADKPNTWSIEGDGAGSLNDGALTFSGIQQLYGGSSTDDFIITDAGKAHTLAGGIVGESNTLDIRGASEALWLSLDTESTNADIRLVGMDEVVGNVAFNHRLEGDDRNNRWSIDRQNGGVLNDVLHFSDLNILQGNGENDVFTFAAAGRLDGHINGGGGGDNRVDLSGLAATEQWTIATTAEAPADLNVVNIQTLDGGSEGEHTLLGTNADNQWTVTNTNSGTLENLKFTGVANLMGGTGKDDVVFDVAGELSGYIDGGAGTGQNTVDFSKKTTAVAVSVGTDQGDLRRFDQLTGNNRQTTLTGLDDDNRWRLDSGENTGYLNDRLKFSGVTDLVGGDGGNTFSLNGGLVTGLITGGSGEDRFDLVLRPDAQGQLELNAVEGHDELWVSGGASGSRVEYFARRNAAERLTYTGDNNQVFEVAFEGVERVQDDVTASELRINTSLEADTLSMENNGIQVNGLAQLDYNNKTDLTLAANSDDTVELTGAVAIPGRLEIRNASVQQATQERLKARELHLVGVGEFGTPGGAIYTDIDALYADVGQGGLALNNGGVLNLAQLNSLGATAIYSAGNITSTADLSAAGELHLRSDLGGIRLEGDNRFSGTTHLEAAHEIQLHHDRDLTLGRVSGDTLKLVNQGDVIGQGAWDLNTAVFSLEGDLSALNADNRLGMLRIERAGNVALLSDSALNVGAVESGGDVDLSANGLTLESLLNAENLTLNAGEGTLHVDGAVDIEQRLEANASAIAVNQTLTAGAMVLDAGEGALEVNATLRADSAEGVTLVGGTFAQNARINSAGTIAVNAHESLQQRAELTASAGIELVSGGELTMSRGARSTTEAGAIRYQAGDNLTVSYLDNTDGTIALVSDRRIETAIGEEVGLRSQRIEFEAVEGIGTQTSLAIQTKELHATNEGGNVALTNNGALRIERLATNGDIIFRNEGTVELDNRNGPVFDQASNDAIEAGGIGNANYDLGRVSLTVANGNLVALGPIDARKPDFVGLRGNFLVGGDIGSPVRPLVLYFKESLVLNGTRSWRPYWGFNDAPDTFENNSEIPVSQDLMNAGEQLVEVESLEEIDPAIFTEVRNYTYDEVSILMPPDQRYGDEDDEQRYSADY